jgi:hypothetical protein
MRGMWRLGSFVVPPEMWTSNPRLVGLTDQRALEFG